jgi:predicted metal-dependent phosphoesterase TrpH
VRVQSDSAAATSPTRSIRTVYAGLFVGAAMYAEGVLIDLHCHSLHSDGSEAAHVVAARAAERGVELFCLTDHDTCDGYPATVGACSHVVRGLELSCAEEGRTVHLLLYDTAHDDARWRELEASLVLLREARKDRIRAIVERLAGLDVVLDAEVILARASGRTVGRPDIAYALVTTGVVASPDEAFVRFLADGAPAFVPLNRLGMADGIRLALEAGAKVSLAHPHTLGERAAELVARHRVLGLEGLECYYGNYNIRHRRRWLNLAKRHKMVVTGGSDFHGATRVQLPEVGVDLPPEHARRLCAWLGIESAFS